MTELELLLDVELELVAVDEIEEDEELAVELVMEEEAADELDDDEVMPDVDDEAVDVVGAVLGDEEVDVTGEDEVVTTLDVVDDDLLLERATYAPAPATTMTTTKMIAMTVAAIPLLLFSLNFEVIRDALFSDTIYQLQVLPILSWFYCRPFSITALFPD